MQQLNIDELLSSDVQDLQAGEQNLVADARQTALQTALHQYNKVQGATTAQVTRTPTYFCFGVNFGATAASAIEALRRSHQLVKWPTTNLTHAQAKVIQELEQAGDQDEQGATVTFDAKPQHSNVLLICMSARCATSLQCVAEDVLAQACIPPRLCLNASVLPGMSFSAQRRQSA
jgi:hypothetical protein